MKIEVLYEDNHLIAVKKPVGVLTQRDRTDDVSLMEEVKKHLKEKYKKPGNVFLGLLHRLDRPVSGVVLFAKTSKGAARLAEQFREGKVEKMYSAVVVGEPKNKSGDLISYIEKDEKRRKSIVYQNEKTGTQRAELSYETIQSNGKYSLLKVQIKTGKFHQIRAQLASMGYPVLGDKKYGAPFSLPDRSICLSATSLSFFLATRHKVEKIELPVPYEWNRWLK